mgnify:FL=1
MKNMRVSERRKRRYQLFLYAFLGFALGMFLWASYSYYEQKIPNIIRIQAGTSQRIDLKVPASGVLNVDSDKVIALNQPVTIVAGESPDTCQMELRLFGVLPLKSIDIEVIENTRLIPVGQPIGIYMKTQGVLEIDTGTFEGPQGQEQSPSVYKLQAGDYVMAMDGVAVTGKRQIKEYVENGSGRDIVLQVSRNEKIIQVRISPMQDQNGVYKIGTWLRDSAQGIGTMTFLDEELHFGALGHGINDTDTGELLQLGSGLLYHTEIVAIRKGERGTPGELTGIIEYQPEQVSGVIMSNTEEGIYGVASQAFADSITTQALPVGLKQDVKEGDAQILCNIDGQTKYYDVRITRLMPNAENLNRQIALTVTDEELLQLTGGIVQGMSGAPIIQDGRIIGAVTHVLVNDSTSGYGIFIENML